MKQVPRKNTDDALIQEFLNKGGKVSVGKTKPMPKRVGSEQQCLEQQADQRTERRAQKEENPLKTGLIALAAPAIQVLLRLAFLSAKCSTTDAVISDKSRSFRFFDSVDVSQICHPR